MKKILPLLLLVALILTGCGNTTSPEEIKIQEPESISGSMIDLLAKEKSLKCEFRAEIAETSLSGITYVANGKVRSDFNSTIDGNELTSHLIGDNEFLYTWNDQEPGQGVKININEMPADDDAKAQEEFKDNGFNNYAVVYDYKCSDWEVNENMFKTPQGFNFTDFAELMKKLTAPAPVYRPRSVINYAKECAACAEIMHFQTRLSCQERYGCK